VFKSFQPFNVTGTSCNKLETANNSSYNVSSKYYFLELPSLKPYRNYTVLVLAVNEKGNGQESNVSFTTEIAGNLIAAIFCVCVIKMFIIIEYIRKYSSSDRPMGVYLFSTDDNRNAGRWLQNLTLCENFLSVLLCVFFNM
jgi:hypothetical protein